MADASQIAVTILGIDALSGPARTAAGSLGALESAASRGIGAFTNMAAAAAKAALAVGAIGAGAAAAGFTNAVSVAASFEQQLSAIAAVSSKAEVEVVGGMKAISAAALELGKSTSFSATEAAAGMEEMVKAGVSLKDVMNGGAKAALDLAAAGALSVSEAATVASSAMNAFGLAGSDLAHIADTLANAASASATDIHQLGFGLASVGAVAHTVGLSFEDTTTAIAEFAQAGLKGSDAGTSFKTLLLSLTPSTKPAIATMKELGIITADGANQFFDAQGKVKSFAEISGVLQNAMKGLTKEQQINALQTMFGTDAIRAAAIMAEKGAEGANQLTQAQKDVGGAAAVAKERLNNLKGAMEALGGSWEVIRIKVGTPFLPILTRGVQLLTEALNKAEPSISAFAERAAAGLDKLISRAIEAGPKFTAMGAGLLAFGRQGIAVAQGALPRLIAGFDRLKEMVSGLSLGGIAGGATSLFGALIASFKQVEPVAASVGRAVVRNITETFHFIATRVLPPVVSIIEQTGRVLERTLLPNMLAVGTVGRGIFGDTLDWLSRDVWPSLLSIVERTSNFFNREILPTLPAVAAALRTTLGETVQWLAADVWPNLEAAASLAWRFISGTIIPALPGLAAMLREHLGGALTWIGETGWPALVKGATAAWKFLQDNVIPVVRDTYAWLKEKLPEAIASVTGAFETIKGKVAPIVQAALNGDIAAAIKGLGAAFGEFATLAAGWIGEQVAKINWANVWSQAKDVLASAASWFSTAAQQFSTWLGEQVAAIDWANVWNKAVQVFDAAAMWFGDAAAKLATWIGDQVAAIDWGSVWARAVNVVQGMAQWFVTVVTDFATWIGEKVAGIDWASVWAQAKDVIKGMAQWFLTVATDFATWIGEGVAKIPWATVWAEITGMTEPMQKAFEAEAAKLDWKAITTANKDASHQIAEGMNEMIRSVDWTAVGQEFAANMFKSGGGLETAMRAGWKLLRAPLVIVEPLIEFIKTADWGAVAQAFADVVAGFIEEGFRRAWAAISPNIPSWLDPTPRPPAGAMPFPVGTGTQTPNPGSAGASRGQQTRSVMSSAEKGPLDNSSRQSFIRTAYPYALEAAGGDATLAQQLIATAISENGNVGSGKDLGADMGFNVGGIQGVKGPAGSFWASDAGNMREFAAYNNLSEGFAAVKDLVTTAPRYRAAYERYQQTGDVDAFWGEVNQAGYAEDPEWGRKVGSIRRNQVAPITSSLPTFATSNMSNASGPGSAAALTDFQQTQRQWAANAAYASGVCGPRLASLFADAVGRPPTPEEAVSLAESMGLFNRNDPYFQNASMFDEYATALIQRQNPGSTARVEQAMFPGNAKGSEIAQANLAGGSPLVGFNTSGHYFGADQFDPKTGKFHVGGTGLSAGGGEWMSVDEMTAKMGPLLGVLTMVGAQADMTTASTTALGGAFTGTVEPMQAATGAATATGEAITGVATTTATAAETTTASIGGVTASFDLMAQGAMGSVTTMGESVLTTMADMSGNTVATVTTMTGEVTNQSATLANGVSLNMAQMGVSTTSSVNEMAGTITTVMTDTAGNAVTTVTDMSGQVIGQFTSMQTEAGSALSQLANASEEQFNKVVGAAEAVPEATEGITEAFQSIEPPDLGDVVDQFNEVAEAAEEAAEAAEDARQAFKSLDNVKGGNGKKTGFEKRARGGWTQGLTLVGEEGPELASFARPTYISNADDTRRLMGGGGISEEALTAAFSKALASMPRRGDITIHGAGTEEVTSKVLRHFQKEELMYRIGG